MTFASTSLQWAAWSLILISVMLCGCESVHPAYVPKAGHTTIQFVRWHQ